MFRDPPIVIIDGTRAAFIRGRGAARWEEVPCRGGSGSRRWRPTSSGTLRGAA